MEQALPQCCMNYLSIPINDFHGASTHPHGLSSRSLRNDHLGRLSISAAGTRVKTDHLPMQFAEAVPWSTPCGMTLID